VGCAISTPLWYFASLATSSYIICVILGMVYGALLAGFVPLSALMPSMVERHDKGAALAILNLGAGGAAFIGPAIATALNPFVGYSGVVVAYSALYFVSAVLTSFIVSPGDPGEEGEVEEDAVATTA
jgi:predicted MFS family arabinose efflux permease